MLILSFQDDVVDQTGVADAHGGCQHARLEIGDLDVVDVEVLQQLARPHRVFRRERARERQCSRALLGRQPCVPRREGEAVVVANGRTTRTSTSTFRSRTIRFTTATCCASFWPKNASSGADDVEELQTDRRDGAEVARAVRALERGAELLDLDPGLEAGGYTSAALGSEEDVDAGLAGDVRVARLVARVAVEVAAALELGRVDEERRDDDVRRRAGGAKSATWPAWNAPIVGTSAIGPVARWRERGAHLVDRAHDLHRAVASASTS